MLLVDDDRSIAAPHRRRLEGPGYRVTNNVALTIARQATPKAIFLTVERLGSERTPFLQALRRDDQTRHIPVTVLPTGHDDSLERVSQSAAALAKLHRSTDDMLKPEQFTIGAESDVSWDRRRTAWN